MNTMGRRIFVAHTYLGCKILIDLVAADRCPHSFLTCDELHQHVVVFSRERGPDTPRRSSGPLRVGGSSKTASRDRRLDDVTVDVLKPAIPDGLLDEAPREGSPGRILPRMIRDQDVGLLFKLHDFAPVVLSRVSQSV